MRLPYLHAWLMHCGRLFITEDSAFASLFTLDDVTIAVRVEVNNLRHSTLELLVDPRLTSADAPFQGTADMLTVRVLKNVNPHNAISTFNNVFTAARRRPPVDDDEVKALFIKALEVEYYLPVTSRLRFSATSEPPWTF
ncbi:hypothetical protein CYMTET_3169 [Cymbomonas tetramitiformis]|uniref:Uncharacterized protein n=1 Tax=Cymbomonas tetramitiformis TaxID=36881 RepID=A0AAE0H3T9_9CHLO|nr:hypothetical protein CYMTET_3169 [Cymbomonas tetramitiformis]